MTDTTDTSNRSAHVAMDRKIERPRWPGRRRLVFGGGAVAAAALAVLLVRLIPPAHSLRVDNADIRTGEVRTAPFQDYLPVRAEVAPLTTVVLSAVAGGQVANVQATDGAYVARGTALATLSNPQLKMEVSAREAEISSRLSDTSGLQLTLERNQVDRDKELADTTYQLLRSKRALGAQATLHDKGFVSDAGLARFTDEAAYYQSRVGDLTAAKRREGASAAAQATEIRETAVRLKRNLAEVEQSLDALVIRAPMEGRLTNFTLKPGQTIKPGDELGQLGSEGAYKVTAQVDEYYLARLSLGQSAQAQVDGRSMRLTVSRVLPQVVNGRFTVELMFVDRAPAGLRRGQSLEIRITLGDTRPALVAPYGAWVESSGGAYAFVLQPGGGRAERRPVTVGRRNPEEVEILKGLRPGERLITSAYGGYEKFSTLVLR